MQGKLNISIVVHGKLNVSGVVEGKINTRCNSAGQTEHQKCSVGQTKHYVYADMENELDLKGQFHQICRLKLELDGYDQPPPPLNIFHVWEYCVGKLYDGSVVQSKLKGSVQVTFIPSGRTLLVTLVYSAVLCMEMQ